MPVRPDSVIPVKPTSICESDKLLLAAFEAEFIETLRVAAPLLGSVMDSCWTCSSKGTFTKVSRYATLFDAHSVNQTLPSSDAVRNSTVDRGPVGMLYSVIKPSSCRISEMRLPPC